MRTTLNTRLGKIEAATPVRDTRVLRVIGDHADYGRFIAGCDIDEDVLIIHRLIVAPSPNGPIEVSRADAGPSGIEVAPEAFDGVSNGELAAS